MEHRPILAGLVKVAKRGVQTEGKVKGIGAGKAPHVLPHPLDVHLLGCGIGAGFVQEQRCTIDSSDRIPVLGKGDRIPPRSAAQIEHRGPCTAAERHNLGHLLDRRGKAGVGKHEGVRRVPECVICKPVA